MNYQAPEARALSDMLSMIIGGEAKAKVAPALEGDSPDFVAIYINRDDEVVATCCSKLHTAASLGSALSMIPAGGVKSMEEENQISKMALDNFYEVMNIFSSLLMNDKTEHLRLSEVVRDAGKRLKVDNSEEVIFTLELGNYGAGELVFNFT
ncbi:hypothetical protein [Granulosicoccus antarcticus]|uniref:Chemotaxis phosphatase CheX-like domain-containing protein n=1 Tax=Granulosicoccus antarcticus IMCC3135 TaxID=1192854 RepID=A0A2Z2NRQ4_9GAMM|nr:hypothetical protein [Granulosicoccus antarcticus]ASJ71420.1 hypothetical protein IMCC3135_06565 [Granulosicoccus antarcticus IMCC3135]